MTRASVLHEVRQMRVEELYARQHRRELTRGEAAEILGVAERTFRRWRERYDAEGMVGVTMLPAQRVIGCTERRSGLSATQD
jgi:transposase